MKRALLIQCFLVVLLLSTTLVQAGLLYLGTDTLGNGLIYDDDLDITWYDYTKAPDTWFNHTSWAENLTVTVGDNTYSDWRLPENIDGQYATMGYDGSTYSGWNITHGEFGHLFYTELGNVGSRDTSGALTGCGNVTPSCLTNFGDFQNLVSGRYYSSDCVHISQYAWYFDTNTGTYYVTPNYTSVDYGIAVHPGMVTGGAVAGEPTTWGNIKASYR